MRMRSTLAAMFVFCSWFTVTANYSEREDLQVLVDELVSEYAFDPVTLTSVFETVEHKPAIIEAITRPAEKAKPWFEYRQIFMNQRRINDGAKFIRKHKATLARAYEEYGVPEYIVAAIIGVETNYGSNMGRYRVIDALATLGFDYPDRAEFFRGELKQFLILACEERIKPFHTDQACIREQSSVSSGQGRDIYQLVGSYAGAMGYGQFIPTSYRKFAIDFDSDGVRDIWNNPTDAIGSVANYFAAHNWTKDGIVLELVELQSYDDGLAEYVNKELEPSLTVAEWQKLGVRSTAPSTMNAALFAFKLDNKEPPTLQYVLGFDNFYSISRYNISRLYSRAVFELAEAIRNKL